MGGVLELFQCIKVEQLGEEQNQHEYDKADFLKLFQGIQANVKSCEADTKTRGHITVRG